MGWPTHDVTNQFDELQDYNLYATDTALQEAVTRHGGASAHGRHGDYGALMGTADSYALAVGHLADRDQLRAVAFCGIQRSLAALNKTPAGHQVFGQVAEALHRAFPHPLGLPVSVLASKRMSSVLRVSLLLFQALKLLFARKAGVACLVEVIGQCVEVGCQRRQVVWFGHEPAATHAIATAARNRSVLRSGR